jgi:VanZ family protein
MHKIRIKYWGPVVIWMIFIFFMSTGAFSSENTSLIIGPVLKFLVPGIPSDTLDIIHVIIRKLAHLTEYFVLGLLLFRAFRSSSGTGPWKPALFTVLVIVLYASSDEFHQIFVSSRTPSAIDLCIDIAGGVFGQAANALRHPGPGRTR